MEQERIQQAMARIEAAASRIEHAARAVRAPVADHHLADDQLANKHAALKREAWAALAEIDTLIEAIEA
jgi:hypothetical protein